MIRPSQTSAFRNICGIRKRPMRCFRMLTFSKTATYIAEIWGLNIEWQQLGRRGGLCYGSDSITPSVLILFVIENCFQKRGKPFDIKVIGINRREELEKVTIKSAVASARRE